MCFFSSFFWFSPPETSHNLSLKDPISCNLLHLASARSHLVCLLTHVYCFPSRLRGLISTQSTSELHQLRQAGWRSWFSQDSVRRALPLVRFWPFPLIPFGYFKTQHAVFPEGSFPSRPFPGHERMCFLCGYVCVCLFVVERQLFVSGSMEKGKWRGGEISVNEKENCIMCRFAINYSYSCCFTLTCLHAIIKMCSMCNHFLSRAQPIYKERLMKFFVSFRTKESGCDSMSLCF